MTIKWSDIATSNINDIIQESTEGIHLAIDSIAEEISRNKKIKFIFISGPSASGKTTFARTLENKLDGLGIESHTLSLDDFFLNRNDLPFIRDNVRDFDSVAALDLKEIHKCFKELEVNNLSYIPVFDFLKGERSPERKQVKICSGDVVIAEGIHSFNPLIQEDISEEMRYNIYISPMSEIELQGGGMLNGRDLRLIRRMIRDYYTRGHSFEFTIRQWPSVIESEEKYIYPHIDKADYKFDTYTLYEPMIYRYLLEPLVNTDNEKLMSIIDMLFEFEPLSPSVVPQDSIIKEFTLF